MTSRCGPVSDRVTDLDHTDLDHTGPEHSLDAHQIRGPGELPIRVLAAA
jgi:hypothetical protein